MSIEIKVPPLGESVSEATVASWLKQPGDAVSMDETIIELETDKVTLEVNAPVSGVLGAFKVQEGDSVEVGDLMGTIEEGALAVSSMQKEPSSEISKSAQSTAPIQSEAVRTKSETASPAALKNAADAGINIASISGSGRDGRVTKGDVLEFSARGHSSSAPSIPQIALDLSNAVAPALAPSSKDSSQLREERVKMTRLRKTIASRLKEAQNTAAMLTTFNEVDMTNIMAARKKYQDQFIKKHDVKLGFMSFFVKAAIAALKEIPAVNSEIDGEELVYKNHYDIGIAVSTPTGLVVPVVRDADQLGFADVEKSISVLGKKGRDGKLSMGDLTGGTFTITNGGTFGSLMSTPILNPPQSAIMGMHKIQERPMVVNGKIEVCPMMYLALTYDHRIIDGREAVTFLVRVKECIENPERILFEI